MSVSDAGNRDQKRSDGNGCCNFTACGKVPSFFNARKRRPRAGNGDGSCGSCCGGGGGSGGSGSVAGIDSRVSGKKRAGDGAWVGRAFCIGGPRALESLVASCSSDPNDPKFTPEMMRDSLEKNDFYSKECNPHLRR